MGCAYAHPFIFKVIAMKKRLRDVIYSIDETELQKIKQDLDSGGHHLKKFIDHEIKCRLAEKHTTCSVCTNELNHDNVNTFTLIFGPKGFQKKASFCGKDCLEYFIKQWDSMKEGKIPKTIL